MRKRDFSRRRSFPGTLNTNFDVLLRALDAIQKLPAPVIWAGLLGLAWIAALAQPGPALALWLFMLGDWVLLWLLPGLGRSYGPPSPPAVILAPARALIWLLPRPAALVLEAIGSLLVLVGFYIEPARLTVTHQTLASPKLAAGPPLRVLHLGDLHVERITGRERKLVAAVHALQPDLILFTGDFLNLSYLEDPQAQAACRWVLAQMAAPLGLFAVTGSPAVDHDDTVAALLDGLPWRWLKDEVVTIVRGDQRLDLVGLACSHKPFIDGPKLRQLVAARPQGSRCPFSILLYHSPDLAPDAAEAGIDLQLSGHTHGGQVRLPYYGALITGSLYGKALEAGGRQLGGLRLYVTRGIGMEGAGAPRVRFLCPPEIVLWELSGA